jgi:hypothetical protein
LIASFGYAGPIFVSLPDASDDDIGNHAHDWGNDQRYQELAHGCTLPSNRLIVAQRNRFLRFSGQLGQRLESAKIRATRDHQVDYGAWRDDLSLSPAENVRLDCRAGVSVKPSSVAPTTLIRQNIGSAIIFAQKFKRPAGRWCALFKFV